MSRLTIRRAVHPPTDMTGPAYWIMFAVCMTVFFGTVAAAWIWL